MTELSLKAAALVRAARGTMRPSSADRERISQALRARLGDAALPLEWMATAPTAWHPAWAKLAAMAGAVGVAGAAAFFTWGNPASVPAPQLPSRPAWALSATVPAPLPEGSASVAPVANVPPPEPSVASARRAQDHLAQEVAILSRATSALHAGRAASALRALDEHQRRFPNGLLSEERRSARAQALCVLGRRDEGEVELGLLTRNSPQSPSTVRAKQVCGIGPRTR